MTEQELKERIKSKVTKLGLVALRTILVEFKDRGGSQNQALNALKDLRSDYEDGDEEYDKVLDLMDFVVGYCAVSFRIW